MNADLSIQRVAVDAEHFGSASLVTLRLAKSGLYVFFFEFIPGMSKSYTPVDHFDDQRFQLLFQNLIPTESQVLAPPALDILVTN